MSGRTNKGFSLVELLVAVAIMVVLVGVMVPTLISHIHKARVAVDWGESQVLLRRNTGRLYLDRRVQSEGHNG